MSDPQLADAFRALGIDDYVTQAEQATLARLVAAGPTEAIEQPNPERLPRLGFLFERQGVIAFSQQVVDQRDDTSLRETFAKAFACWRALVSFVPVLFPTFASEGVSFAGLNLIESELRNEPLPPLLTLACRLAVSGLLCERITETRLELERFEVPPSAQLEGWRDRVTHGVFSAFVLLVRKAGGWQDINRALELVDSLRSLQQEYEETYLEVQGDMAAQRTAAVELVGLYNLAQLVTLVGEYLQSGDSTITQVNVRLDRHHERAVTAFEAAQRPLLAHLADLVWVGCRQLTQNALWTHIPRLGEAARAFAQELVSLGRPNPVFELWPSQQAALRRNLLDTYPRAIIVEMPTSAGKTLLAKFVIVQTRTLNPHGIVAYIVPTRALVNQVTVDLRADFRHLDPPIRVEQAVPAFELDPTENRLLRVAPGVLVTTPEKLDLLIRQDHPVTRNIALIIADEAHNLRDGERGARLELLLGTIKRERATARFLLLSPFLPRAEELVTWLGDQAGLDPIAVDWKPSRKMVGTVEVDQRGNQRHLIFETLPAADNVDIKAGVRIPVSLDVAPGHGGSITSLTQATVRSQIGRRRGTVLIYCDGPAESMKRARQIATQQPRRSLSRRLEAVSRYIDAEMGSDSGLHTCLQHGVVYHHAGMSHEARWLIEALIREREVDVVCGTSTLAQGVNFPIATVVFETLEKGTTRLTHNDFWNIAGRAGRALTDGVGIVAFPTPTESKKEEYREFLQEQAEVIVSQLAVLLDRVDEIGDQFNLHMIERFPNLSVLLQFLAHAMRVAGTTDLGDEVDDILRASLVYHQAQRQGSETVERLVRLCRTYLDQIRFQRGLLVIADKTGFATPSVLQVLSRTRNNVEFTDPASWNPARLFGADLEPLRRRIEAVAEIPEIHLGQGVHGQPFSPARVAAILRDWVLGMPLDQMADRYSLGSDDAPDLRIAKFSRYLFSQLLGRASWGIGALESVSFSASAHEPPDEVGYVPSMIFFGVQRKEAIWLRMVGVPRIVADNLGQLWAAGQQGQPDTFESIREWVGQLTDGDWRSAIPVQAALTPDDMRLIWQEFSQ